MTLYQFIKKNVLCKTEDQYTFVTVYYQELRFYAFWQDTLSNPQWYERFNKKVEVVEAIGATRH